MEAHTPDFSLDVQGVTGLCPAGESYADQQIATRKIPVLSCEGPCLRGDVARRAANLVAQEVPSFARACHGETFFVPHSAMASWVRREADQVVMIDGCFLRCHGRALRGIVPEQKIVQIASLPIPKKYGSVFSMDDVPEEERQAVARQAADGIIAALKQRAVASAR